MSARPHLRLVPEPAQRPDLRHPRRRDVAVYRVRVHLDGSDPTMGKSPGVVGFREAVRPGLKVPGVSVPVLGWAIA